jgi:hypothetical protein
MLPYITSVPRIVNERTTNWTVGRHPTSTGRSGCTLIEPQAALDKLWTRWSTSSGSTATIRSRLGTSGRRHRERRPATERRFDALHLQGPGTDLTIGLLPSSKWLGADFKTIDGLTHYPNLPTEEVFHDSRSERVDGHTSRRRCRALRLVHRRDPIEFEGGRAVKIDADKAPTRFGATAARRGQRPGSARLALVDKEGRIGPLGTVFTRRCSTRTQPATSPSATRTRSLSRTRPSGIANKMTSTSTSTIGSNEVDGTGSPATETACRCSAAVRGRSSPNRPLRPSVAGGVRSGAGATGARAGDVARR